MALIGVASAEVRLQAGENANLTPQSGVTGGIMSLGRSRNSEFKACPPGRLIMALSCSLVLSHAAAPVLASDSSLPYADVAEVIRKAKVLNQDYPVHVIVNNRDVTVLTRRHYKATDDDLKIDAVLIAKAVLDKFGDRLDRVKVLFRDEDSASGKAVIVTANDIKTYANGTLEPQRFLDSLAIKKVDSDPEAEKAKGDLGDQSVVVSPGPFQEQRLLLLDRINILRKRGTGVLPFEKMFSDIDKNSVANDTEQVKAGIKDLSRRLSEQEDLVRQASRVGSGYGIRGTQGSAADASNRNQRFGSGYGANASSSSSNSGSASTGAGGSFSIPGLDDSAKRENALNELIPKLVMRINQKIAQMNMERKDVEPYRRDLANIESKMQGGNQSARYQGLIDLQNLAKRLQVDELSNSSGPPSTSSYKQPDMPGGEPPPHPFGGGAGGGRPPFNEAPRQ